jgi:hypothetical protein
LPHTVYRTLNLIDNRFYIGVHKTADLNDSYLGSGTALRRAVKELGKPNFRKEVLFIYPAKSPAYAKERELLTAELTNHLCYNLHEGGHGGFEYINHLPDKRARQSEVGKRNKGKKYRPMSEEGRANIAKAQQARFKRDGARIGWKHSKETKRLISERAAIRTVTEETKNMLRTVCKDRKWYNNGVVSKRYAVNDAVPVGFALGRFISSEFSPSNP